MNEWRKVKLGDIGEITSSKRIFRAEYKKAGVPFYRGKEIIQKANNQEVSDEFFISLEKYEEIKNKYSVPLENDILITSVGTVGIPYIVKNEKFYFKDGNINWIRKYANNIYFKYLYYWLISPIGKNQIDSYLIGSTQKALTIEAIKKLEINLPPLNIQKKIAKILSDIDERIELNNKINDNLENLLKIIHNKFINSITGENNIISKIIDITDGTHNSPKAQDTGYPLVTSKHLLAYGVNFESINLISKEDYIEINKRSKVDTGDILISMIGTVGLISYVINSPINFAIKNVALFKTSKNPLYKFFILGYLKSPAGINYIKKNLAGSTQKYISLSELRKMPIITPTKIQLKEYNRQISPIVTQISFLVKENEKLTNLKNYLLSKLMNGEIDVEKIEL